MSDPTVTSDAGVLSCYTETPVSEDAMVDALRRGDLRAFEVTFHNYKALVYNLSYRILLDREDALDVSQEVFLTLFQKIASFRGDSSLKSWLFRITLNRSLNKRKWWNRRGRARTEPLTLLHMERMAGCREMQPDKSCLEHEVEDLLQHCLQRLPAAQRAVILLRDVEGCSYEEIACITGASIGTVKSRIARARAAIQHSLEGALGRRTP
ncbi:MAG: sigma-70 family RNA polymerase sigma factor [Acidobacteria bacterium]|nr:sigma-70 family RNA polymerase sigma factor [Acidobacteriota bacterium]